MAGNAVTAGRAYVLIGAKMDGTFGKTLSSAANALRGLGTTLQRIGAPIAGLGASIVAPMHIMAQTAMTFQDRMGDLAARIGTTTEFLSEMGYAGSFVDLTLEDVADSVTKMSASLFKAAQGSKESAAFMKILGLDTKSLLALNPEEQFLTIADALSKVQDQTVKVAAARALFGRGGAKMLPLLEQGRAGIETQRQEGRRIGATVSAADAKIASEAADMFSRLQAALQGFANVVARTVLPRVTQMTLYLTNLVARSREYLANNPAITESVYAFGRALLVVGSVLVGLGTALKTLAVVVSPGGVLMGLAAILLYTSGALDNLVERWGAVVMAFQIGGRTVGEWLGLVLEAWKALLPAFTAVGKAIGSAFDWAWQNIKLGAITVGDFLFDYLAKLMVKISQGFHALITEDTDVITRKIYDGLSDMTLGIAGAMREAQGSIHAQKIPVTMDAEMARLDAKAAADDAMVAIQTAMAGASDVLGKPLAQAMDTVLGGVGGKVEGLQDIFKGLGEGFTAIESKPVVAGAAASFMAENQKKSFESVGTFSARAAEALTSAGGVTKVQQSQLTELQQIHKILRQAKAEGAAVVYEE